MMNEIQKARMEDERFKTQGKKLNPREREIVDKGMAVKRDLMEAAQTLGERGKG